MKDTTREEYLAAVQEFEDFGYDLLVRREVDRERHIRVNRTASTMCVFRGCQPFYFPIS